MLNPVRSFAKIVSMFTVVASLGIASQAKAQTPAPQLLPVGPVVVVAGGATTSPASGAVCASGSSLHSTDKYGDGCLATQISLTAPRYAAVDSAGNIFFSDYTNGLIRRIDATTGIVNTVAGGATSSPGNSTPCGLNSSIDIYGDNCLSTLVKLGKPAGMAFASNGDLYFADPYNYDVRKIAATSGLIPTGGGIISNVAGAAPTSGTATYGFIVSNPTTPINSATQSNLDAPYDVTFDAAGNLYIAEEFKNAIVAVNLTSTNQTIYGVTLLPGQIWKVVGTTTAAGAGAAGTAPVTCPNGVNPATSSTYGCNYLTSGYTEGGAAGANPLDSPYAVAYDKLSSTLYIANEYNNEAPMVSSAGLISGFAGTQTGYGKDITKRAAAGSFGIGSTFGVATDTLGDVYVTDALSGVIWRVDYDTKTMYVVAGQAAAGCTGATDAFNDGCPANQAIFGKSGTSYATTSNPGIFGISADTYDNLYVGDTITNVIREVGNGTNFGINTTTTVMVHYFKNDSPKANGYVVASTTTGTTFNEVPGNCTMNSDGSQDCPVTINAVPTALGPYSGTLTVTSTTGGPVVYPLTGTYQPTPVTTTKLTYVPSTSTCSGSSNYSTTTSFTFTATISSVGGSVSGQVQFYNNGVALGSPVTPVANVATLTQTFANTGNYSITAKFLGDTYYTTSTSGAQTFTLLTPTVDLTANTAQLGTVTAGQTALYSFTANTTVYGGQIAFACTGLPANSTCVFSPAVLSADACGTTATVALSIYTRATTAIGTSGLSGRGMWSMIAMFAGLVSALLIGLRRRQLGVRLGSVGMALALLLAGTGLMSCSNGVTPALPATPKGSYTITVTALPASTAAPRAGQSQSITFPLVVN